jgi:hypothetical protein
MHELLNASNVMRVLDAVYDVEHPREQWLHRILQSATAALDLGIGVGSLLYTISGPDSLSSTRSRASTFQRAFASSATACTTTRVCCRW